MQITVNPKHLKIAVENLVDSTIMDYSEEAAKLAKIDAKALVKEILADTKFLAALAKDLTEVLDEDMVVESAYNCRTKVIDQLEKQLFKAEAEVEKKNEAKKKAERAREEADRLLEIVKQLESLGYKVSKK